MIPIYFKKIRPGAKTPVPGEQNAKTFDLFWCPEETDRHIVTAGISVRPFKTGVAIELPPGYVLLLKERRGMSQSGIFLVGGLIHASTAGEIIVSLMGMERAWLETMIRPGDAIAQAIPIMVQACELLEAN